MADHRSSQRNDSSQPAHPSPEFVRRQFEELHPKDQQAKTGKKLHIEKNWDCNIQECLPREIRPRCEIKKGSKARMGDAGLTEEIWWNWSVELLKCLEELSAMTVGNHELAQELLVIAVQERQENPKSTQRKIVELLLGDAQRVCDERRRSLTNAAVENIGGMSGPSDHTGAMVEADAHDMDFEEQYSGMDYQDEGYPPFEGHGIGNNQAGFSSPHYGGYDYTPETGLDDAGGDTGPAPGPSHRGATEMGPPTAPGAFPRSSQDNLCVFELKAHAARLRAQAAQVEAQVAQHELEAARAHLNTFE